MPLLYALRDGLGLRGPRFGCYQPCPRIARPRLKSPAAMKILGGKRLTVAAVIAPADA